MSDVWKVAAAILALAICPLLMRGQSPAPNTRSDAQSSDASQANTASGAATQAGQSSSSAKDAQQKTDPTKDTAQTSRAADQQSNDQQTSGQQTGDQQAGNPQTTGQQTPHIMGVIPNYRAVSANTQLPPLSVKGKFILSAKDSLDYGSIIFAAALAGYDQATRTYPEFPHGVQAYGQYFWRGFLDQGISNVFTEAAIPVITKEDPRYYTLGKGGFWRRLGYSASRLVITKTDAGGTTFNFSEVIGNGMAAGIADTYYPWQERTAQKTVQGWLTQIGADGVANIVKEFWPDINRKLFHK